jgi:hypothetical protein
MTSSAAGKRSFGDCLTLHGDASEGQGDGRPFPFGMGADAVTGESDEEAFMGPPLR